MKKEKEKKNTKKTHSMLEERTLEEEGEKGINYQELTRVTDETD